MRWRGRAINESKTRSSCCREVDVWVATASGAGKPYLVPLSFYWSGDAMIVTTTHSSRTGRNFARTGRARAAIGQTRGQVVVIDARVEEMPVGDDVAADVRGRERDEREDGYVRASEFDPRPWDVGYTFFRLVPERIQAWRGDDAEELRDKDLMRDGLFLKCSSVDSRERRRMGTSRAGRLTIRGG